MSTVVFSLHQRPSTIVRIPFIQHARPSGAPVARAAATSPAATATPTARASVPPAAAPAPQPTASFLWEQHPHARDIASLQSRAAQVALPDGLRAHFVAQLSDEAAAKLGKALRTPTVLHDVVDDLPPLVDAVLAGRVPGFGPAALRYTVDLAGELSAHWGQRLTLGHVRAEAASRKALSLDAVVSCHVELTRRTRDVLPAESPERELLDRAAKREARSLDVALDAVEATLGVVARVFERAAGDASYALFLDDAGYAQPAVAAIVAPVRPALDARSEHGAARSTSELTQQQIDRLEGRLRDQLLRLRTRVAAARKEGAALPEVRAMRVLARPAKKKAAATPDGAPAQPKRAPGKRAKKSAVEAKAPVAPAQEPVAAPAAPPVTEPKG